MRPKVAKRKQRWECSFCHCLSPVRLQKRCACCGVVGGLRRRLVEDGR